VVTVVLESTLTCPHCGVATPETMPQNACLFFYECTNCKALLRPKRGDCCVFGSFGSVRCPRDKSALTAAAGNGEARHPRVVGRFELGNRVALSSSGKPDQDAHIQRFNRTLREKSETAATTAGHRNIRYHSAIDAEESGTRHNRGTSWR